MNALWFVSCPGATQNTIRVAQASFKYEREKKKMSNYYCTSFFNLNFLLNFCSGCYNLLVQQVTWVALGKTNMERKWRKMLKPLELRYKILIFFLSVMSTSFCLWIFPTFLIWFNFIVLIRLTTMRLTSQLEHVLSVLLVVKGQFLCFLLLLIWCWLLYFRT